MTSYLDLRVIARLRITFILIVLLALVTTLPFSVGAATTFTDPQNTVSFQVPDGWQQDTTAANPGLIVQYITTNPSGAFNLVSAVLPDGTTLDAAILRVIAGLQAQYSDYQQTNLSSVTVAGEQGTELDYTATSSAGTLVAVSQILVPHNGILYFLTLAAQPQDIGAIQTAGAPILLSWQWLS